MPSKYVVRSFSENSYYHVFNRGVEKRKIFLGEDDYKIFKYYLFIYLAPLETVLGKYPKLPLHLQSKNLNKELELTTYCLMPNHFHLLLKQNSKDTISKFMKQLTNAYTIYFNTTYERTGSLMGGPFKAVRIKADNVLVHINRYIHLNPVVAGLVKDLKDYPWSSYPSYIGIHKDDLCEKDLILGYFSSVKDYESFVDDQIAYAKELDKIKHLTID